MHMVMIELASSSSSFFLQQDNIFQKCTYFQVITEDMYFTYICEIINQAHLWVQYDLHCVDNLTQTQAKIIINFIHYET